MKERFSKNKNSENGSEERMRFSQKIGHFFSTEPQKEKVLRHEDFNAAGDVYYAGISAAYKVAQRLLWLVFILFMIFSLIFNFSEITYDNFFYLIKDFSGAVDTQGSYYETLSYEADARQNFTLYRGGLATVSPSKISIFTATGRRTYNNVSSFSSPFMESSNKYVLVYDTSGTTFALYNSFVRVFTQTLEYPVTNACLAEDGSFAVVTKSADSRSIILVYNKSFHKAAELRANYYVFDLEASRDRNQLAFLTYDAGNGTGRTTLSVRELTSLEESKKIQFDGEFPLACGFLDSGRFAVMTDRYIRIYDRNWEAIETSEDYSNGNLTGYSLSTEGVAVSVTMTSQTRLIAYDHGGDALFDHSVDFNVSDIGVHGEFLFLKTEQGVRRLHATKKDAISEMTSLSSGNGKMLIYNEKTVLICGESKAEYLVFYDES